MCIFNFPRCQNVPSQEEELRASGDAKYRHLAEHFRELFMFFLCIYMYNYMCTYVSHNLLGFKPVVFFTQFPMVQNISAQEEELRASGDAKYRHLAEDLHVEITAFAPPAEAYARIAYSLSEVIFPLNASNISLFYC